MSFRLFRFKIEVQASFLIMTLFFAGAGGGRTLFFIGGWVAIVFVSILVHELGHAFMARAFGADAHIELYAGGGLTHHTHIEGWWRELAVSVAGPLAGLSLGALVWCVGTQVQSDVYAAWVIDSALYVNVWWSLLNLLPVLPYDGGLAFRAVVTHASRHGGWIANGVSIVVAGAGTIYALTQGRFWLAFLGGYGVQKAWRELVELRAERRLDQSWDAWRDEDVPLMDRLAHKVLASSKDERRRAAAIERVAWGMIARGELEGTRKWLSGMTEHFQTSDSLETTLLLLEQQPDAIEQRRSSLDPTMLWQWGNLASAWMKIERDDLLDRLFTPESTRVATRQLCLDVTARLFYAGHFKKSAELGRLVFEAHQHHDDAYNVACSECRLGHLDEALAWLERAVDAGYIDVDHITADEDLAAIRELPGYGALIERVRAAQPDPAASP